MKDNYKNTADRKIANATDKTEHTYSFYSNILQKPFDTVSALMKAEEAYFAEQKAKEDKAAAKKADAAKVEVAFKAMNQARRDYRENILKLTDLYQQELKNLKENFESEKQRLQSALVDAENTYSATLKVFTDKYPEGYHLTLKDGDCETSISGKSTDKTSGNSQDALDNLKEIFNVIFGI